MDKDNDKFSLIYVTYFTQTKIIEEKSFILSSKFNDIIEYFKENIQKSNNNLELKEKYNFKNTQIDGSMNITDLFDINSFDNNNINLYIELEDKLDFNEEKDNINIEMNKESDISVQPVFKNIKLIENNNISNSQSINMSESNIFKIEENEDYSKSKKEESNESKVNEEIKASINDQNIKKEGIKLKAPIIPKLNQSQIINSYKLNSRFLNNKILSKSMYSMYRADDDNTYLENDGDNYRFHDMTPHYKKKKKYNNSFNNGNLSSKLELRIKNPFSESKIIKKRKINALNYSIIYEKEVDINDLPFYNNFELEEDYTCDNDFGNHRLFLSRYLINAKKVYKDFQKEKTQREMNNKYKLQEGNLENENINRTERNKKPKKFIIPDLKINSNTNNSIVNKENNMYSNYIYNNNQLYVVKKKNYSEEKKKLKLKERKLSYNVEKKNQPLKTISNYLTERVIERSRYFTKRYLSGRAESVSPRDKFVPTKLRTAERKIVGVRSNLNFKASKKSKQFFKKITSHNKNKNCKANPNLNNKEVNIKPIIKMDNSYSGKNNLPLLVKKESNKSKNNEHMIDIDNNNENELKQNIMDEYDNLKANNSIEDINQKEQIKNYNLFLKNDLRKNIIIFDSKNEEEKEEDIDMKKDEVIMETSESNKKIKDIDAEISNINEESKEEEKLSNIISENKDIKNDMLIREKEMNDGQKRNEEISIGKEDEKNEMSQDNHKQFSLISISDEAKNLINKNSLNEKQEKEDFLEKMNNNENYKDNFNDKDNVSEKDNDELSKNNILDKDIDSSQINQNNNYNIFNINKSIEINSSTEKIDNNIKINEDEKQEVEPDNSNIKINDYKPDEKESKLNLSNNKKEKLKINVDTNEQENINNVLSNGTFRRESTLGEKNNDNDKSENNNMLNNNEPGIVLTKTHLK